MQYARQQIDPHRFVLWHSTGALLWLQGGPDLKQSASAKSTRSARKSSPQGSGPLLPTQTQGVHSRSLSPSKRNAELIARGEKPNTQPYVVDYIEAMNMRTRPDSGLLPTPNALDSIEHDVERWRERRASHAEKGVNLQKNLDVAINLPSSSPTSATSTAPDSEAQLSLPGASPASLSVMPGSDEAKRMTASSGRKCLELLQRQSPLGSLARMLAASPLWSHSGRNFRWTAKGILKTRWQQDERIWQRFESESGEVYWMRLWKTLKKSDTRSSRLLFRLAAEKLHTNVIESGYAPEELIKTPSTVEAESENRVSRGVSGTSGTLSQEMASGYIANRMLGTPRSTQAKRSERFGKGRTPSPEEAIATLSLLKTPSSVETEGGVMEIRLGCDGHYKLRDQIAMLPTPQHGDYKTATTNPGIRSGAKQLPQSEHNLPRRILLATPQAMDHREDVRQPEERSDAANKGGCANLREQVGTSRGLKLQPAFVEWMMGYPLGFTHVESPDSKPSATPLSRKSRIKSSEPSRKSKGAKHE